jgi:probable HAF family extracellular repeat protein
MNRQYIVTGGARSRSLVVLSTLVGLILLSVLPVCAEYYYYITDLGTLGGTNSRGYGINNATPAKVVGQSTTAGGQTHAFISKPLTDLGTVFGGSDSFARAVNRSGQVVGNATAADGKQHAFIYNPGTFPLADLGTLGGYPCDATAINTSGQVVGSFTTSKTPVKPHPYVWSTGTGMVDILAAPQVPVTWTSGYAVGINDLGQVAGYAIDATTANYRAFLYTPNYGMDNLGTLGGRESVARAINASGKVVGNSRTPEDKQHAFYYGGSGPLVDLGTFGGDASYARAINNKGEVVGQAQLPGNINTPFIWSETTGKIDLSTVVGNNHKSYQEWYLSDALAVNELGVIVGTGSIKTATGSETHAFTLTPATRVTITTASLANGTVGTSYSKTLTATGGASPYTYTWVVSAGSLPPGLTLSSAGALTGKPTANGYYTFTVEARGTYGMKASKEFTMYTSSIFLSSITLPNAIIGTVYGRELAVSGGVKPFTFTVVDGALPAGLSLIASTGYVRGTPTATGSYNFTAVVTDANGVVSPPRSYPLTVVIGPLSVTTASLANATLNANYSKTLAATGGLTPYGWSVVEGSLPPGLTLNATTGTISGKGTTAGTYTFTVQVSDGQVPAVTAIKELSIVVK